jgi:hypothetical protein
MTATRNAIIVPADDQWHERPAHPHWNESGWFGFSAPERNLTGSLYMYHRPNMNYTQAGIWVWDNSGENTWDCLYHDWWDTTALSPEHQVFDYTNENGLSVKAVDLGRDYDLGYDNHGFQMDLRFRAYMDPHPSNWVGGAEEWAPHHYEQGGRVTGHIVVGGEEITIDCLAGRDHSWGIRRYVSNPRGDFPWAIASEDAGFVVTAVSQLPRDTDPIVGTTESLVGGWYMRDGVIADIVLGSGTRRVAQRGADGRPEIVLVTAVDELGRTLEAEGRMYNHLVFPLYPHYYMWWCGASWSFDGLTGYGDEMDYYPGDQARRWLRSLKRG